MSEGRILFLGHPELVEGSFVLFIIMHIAIVTGNIGKYKQISSMLSDGGIFVEQKNIDLIESQSNDMLEVSAYKARQAFDIVGGPVVVDDSGIYFDAYPDFPGVFSKYIFKSLGIDGLVRLFQDQANTGAYFQCVLSYMDALLDKPMQFIGTTGGTIDFSMLNLVEIDNHLPYLSIFIPEGMDTVAQMNPEYFESKHHRTKATLLLRDFLVIGNI